MAQPRKPRWGFRPAKPVCALRRCRPSFSGGKVAALCLASAAMQRFCDASQFLQNLCFLMSLALWEKIPQSIGRRDGAPSPLPGLGPTWQCSAGGRKPSPTKHAVQLSRYVRKCLQSFSARPANFCRVITRACVATLPSVTLLRSSTSCVGADIRPTQRTGWIPSLWDRCVRGPGASGGNFRMPHIPAATKRSQSFDEGNGADSADAVITFRGARTTASRLWEERSKGPLSASQARRGQKRCPGQKPVL